MRMGIGRGRRRELVVGGFTEEIDAKSHQCDAEARCCVPHLVTQHWMFPPFVSPLEEFSRRSQLFRHSLSISLTTSHFTSHSLSMEDPASAPLALAQVEPVTAPAQNPPYEELILSAIAALKDKNGSTKTAIAKYIESNYKELPAGHPALLGHHLKRLTNNGIILMEKLSYKLASTPASAGKRGRGRPRKSNKTIPLVGNPGNPGDESSSVTPVVKRGRGRPPNGLKPKPSSTGSVKRGRGRPPKAGGSGSAGSGSTPSLGKRGRGRPKKSQSQNQNQNQKLKPKPEEEDDSPPVISVLGVVSEEEVVPPILLLKGRPRGRPAKVGGPAKVKKASSGRPRGRPAKVGGPPKPIKVSSGRPRGRPAKIGGPPKPKPVYASTGRPRGRPAKVFGGTPKVSSGRPVGRPRKVGGTSKPVKGSSGRPVGRPRKNVGSGFSAYGGGGGGTPAPATVPVGE